MPTEGVGSVSGGGTVATKPVTNSQRSSPIVQIKSDSVAKPETNPTSSMQEQEAGEKQGSANGTISKSRSTPEQPVGFSVQA